MKKETYEWIHSWCDNTSKEDLPRILLVGDSITHWYQEQVRELLKDVAYVDYVSASYAIDNPLYVSLIKSFYSNSKYDILHFNHGLHGFHMNVRTYKSKIEKFLQRLNCKNTIVANSTIVYQKGNDKIDRPVQKVIEKRNAKIEEIANENGYLFNDLYSVSKIIPKEFRKEDGTHYTDEGSLFFAKQVAEKIKNLLK